MATAARFSAIDVVSGQIGARYRRPDEIDERLLSLAGINGLQVRRAPRAGRCHGRRRALRRVSSPSTCTSLPGLVDDGHGGDPVEVGLFPFDAVKKMRRTCRARPGLRRRSHLFLCSWQCLDRHCGRSFQRADRFDSDTRRRLQSDGSPALVQMSRTPSPVSLAADQTAAGRVVIAGTCTRLDNPAPRALRFKTSTA